MLKRKLGNSGIDASVIGLGTWVTGGWMWGGADDNESIKAIHAGLDSGIDLIDTAPVYGFGHSEEVVGKAIKDRRDKVILATKCGLVWDKEAGVLHFTSNEKGVTKDEVKYSVYKYLNPDSIREEVERSLKRLQTDYIDLYQTHWQDETTPIADTMAMLEKLKDEGKIRAIGVSNASVDQMKEYGNIDSAQEKYNMLARKLDENGITDYCSENEIAILAYSPLANGLLTGKINENTKFGEGDLRINNSLFTSENIRKVNSMLSELTPVAEETGKTIAQLVMAWTLQRKGITHLLVGARNKKQAIENAGGGDSFLSDEQSSQLDKIYSSNFPE
jgi:methylglyoxal reductase